MSKLISESGYFHGALSNDGETYSPVILKKDTASAQVFSLEWTGEPCTDAQGGGAAGAMQAAADQFSDNYAPPDPWELLDAAGELLRLAAKFPDTFVPVGSETWLKLRALVLRAGVTL